MRKRMALSEFKPKILGRLFLKFDSKRIVKKLTLEHGNIIPFRVLPKNSIQHQEIFVLLRELKYIPNHELKLFIK